MKTNQVALNLFSCCARHDDGVCDVDCFHHAGVHSCTCSQRIVCCKQCPYYHYTKQTMDAFIEQKRTVASLLHCTPEAVGQRVYAL